MNKSLENTNAIWRLGLSYANGNIIRSLIPTACCAISMTDLVIDQAAYIDNIEGHYKSWESIIPENGNITVISTPNRKHNWFYHIYHNPSKFHIIETSYLEHPDYSNEEWVNKVKESLDPQNWAIEVEAKFD